MKHFSPLAPAPAGSGQSRVCSLIRPFRVLLVAFLFLAVGAAAVNAGIAVAAPAPEISLVTASEITSHTVAVSGSVDPAEGEDITACYFEYVDAEAFNSSGFSDPTSVATVPCQSSIPSSPPYSAGTDVRAELTGLEGGTVYHLRLAAVEAGEASYGPPRAIATLGVPIHSFTVAPSTTQAGGHPDVLTSFSFGDRLTIEQSSPCNCKDPRDITSHLPTGLIGDPHNVPQCSQVDFGDRECSPNTQVGLAVTTLGNEGIPREGPVFNLEPNSNQAGLLGFNAPISQSPVFLVLSARTGGDYGLNSTLINLLHTIPPSAFSLNLWGVPAEPSHDNERYPVGYEPGRFNVNNPPVASTAPLQPFLSNPTTCSGPLSTSLEITAYDGGTSSREATWPATTGCDQLSFNPSLFAQPTTTQTDSPSGLAVDLSVPQLLSPTAPSPSEIRATTVTLPQGMSINPNAADGKTSCSDAEARFGTEEEARCPEDSKVGTLSLTSSALPAPIPGAIYIGEPEPGNRYRIFLTAGGYDTYVKFAGTVEPNPQTGQLTVSFQNLPQSPFSEFDLHFFGSERGLLATPTRCGTYPVTSTFTPWDAALSPQTSTQYFTLDSGPDEGPCPGPTRPFGPDFGAGVTDATAAVHSPFHIDLTRPDGDQDLSALTVRTPPGFSATLKGVSYCPDAALAAAAAPGYSGLQEEADPSCPAASQIGTATVGAGAGTHPVYVSGKVYLAGPYKGAPLSLAVITPAVSGPYDLGNVVIRAALDVNPETAQITAVSDPLPQILQGIPLRLRSVLLELNRPGFTLNPTNCNPFSVSAEVSGSEGALATPSEHFQAANCRGLPFAPKLTTSLSGSTRHTGTPSLHTTLTYPGGGSYANIARVSVTLPHSEFLENAHLRNPCTRSQFAEGQVPGERCPPDTDIGFAKAESPLLEKPVEGPVYLRTAPGRHLPDIVAALNGQIDLTLVGHVESVPNHLRTTFETVPDAPVSRFTLTLDGGNKGLIANSTNLCASTNRVNVQMTAQNGKTANQNPVLQAPCAKKKRKGHRVSRVHKNRRARR